MRNDDHGRIALVEHVFQPANGVDVEVIGRLVQQQDVGIREQRLCQQDAQLPAGRDTAHRPLMLVDRDTDAQQQFAGACLGSVTIVFREFRFQVGGFHVVVVGRVWIGINCVALGHRGPHFRMAHHDDVQHAHVFERKLILPQFAQTFVDVEHHITGRRLQIAAQNLHEGRFAAAVGTDQAVAIAIAELDGNVLKQRLGAELHRDICSRKH